MPPPAAVQRETIGTVVTVWTVRVVRTIGAIRTAWTAVLALLGLLLRLAGDEGRKPVHVLFGRRLEVLRARLRVLRRLLVRWLARCKRFSADGRLLAVAVVVGLVGNIAGRSALLLVIGLALAELFLRRCDQAEVMLGVLIIVFGGNRVSGALCVPGKLQILFRDMGRRSPNFHVRPVGLVHARQRILVVMMMMTTFAVATPHALVLTVSHGCCSANPLICGGINAAGLPY